ncbi:MAG: hypothetical protein WA821_09435 [Anaerolineales bacterium]
MNNTMRGRTLGMNAGRLWSSIISQRSRAFGFMIIGALLAFEIFNYSTTEFALKDVLGNLSFAGIGWATILSIAFCGIDFAGIARLFTPEQGRDEPAEVWYLFGAWILAAAMNATLTWWGVSVAIANHVSQGSAVLSNATIQSVVPVFVAIMVWVIRVLIIGTFSIAGERMFAGAPRRTYSQQQQQTPARNDRSNNLAANRPVRPAVNTTLTNPARPIIAPASSFRAPQPKPVQRPESPYVRTTAEPTYHNLMSSSRPAENYLDERG